ncbi:hypothetical protein EGW08_018874 [Elysia chlorotica]|uniref:Uncharacterized protein n=1 Tax=Elysia chlorotica TaxID=188477 RepID=A0A3S1B2E2_ELYCH|nr:hypothetical protein EGW08_018874 [Elysia chlorotica]
MADKRGGDAGGDGSGEQPTEGRQLQTNVYPPGSGEVVISIGDALKKDEKDELAQDLATHLYGDPALLQETWSQPSLTPVLKTKRIGHKLLVSCRLKPLSLRSKLGGGTGGARGGGLLRKWLGRFWDDDTPSTCSDMLTVIMAFLGLSVLALFVCLVATKVMMEGCGWSSSDRSECVFRRYVPPVQYPNLEIIHDFRSNHSALVEGRHGRMRCMLFDMSRYVPGSDSCPTDYPNSLDERVGVPAVKSRLSRNFPRRFAKHSFIPLHTDYSSLKDVVGPAIADRCLLAKLYVTLLVEVRMETPRCLPARQYLVDQLLRLSDSSYTALRSKVMSNVFAQTVVMYENWNRDPRSLIGHDRSEITAESGNIKIDGEKIDMQLEALTSGVMAENSKIIISKRNKNGSVETLGAVSLSVDSQNQQNMEEEGPKLNTDTFKEIFSKRRNRINMETSTKGNIGITTDGISRNHQGKSGEWNETNEEMQIPSNDERQEDFQTGQVDEVGVPSPVGEISNNQNAIVGKPIIRKGETASTGKPMPVTSIALTQTDASAQKPSTDFRSNGENVEKAEAVSFADGSDDQSTTPVLTTTADSLEKPEAFEEERFEFILRTGVVTNAAVMIDVETITSEDNGAQNNSRNSVDADEDKDPAGENSPITTSDHQPVEMFRLLSLIKSETGIADLAGPAEAASLLSGMTVESETRRYFLWRGRIVRICLIKEMP